MTPTTRTPRPTTPRRAALLVLAVTTLLATGCPCRCGGSGDSTGTTRVGTDRPS
jgi:hypothetical protein